MSRIRADRYTNRLGTGAPTFSEGVNVVGISSLGITTVTGVGQTALTVNGDARVTGVLTVGQGSVTINGSSDEVRLGSGVTFYGGTGDIFVTGNVGFSSIANLYGDGTQSNPFKGLEGANQYKNISSSVPPDGQYYVEFDGVKRQAYFMFHNPMTASTNAMSLSDKAWMRVDSSLATIAGATTAMGHEANVNPTIDSNGVVGVDHIINAMCSETAITYAITLPTGCLFRYIRCDIYRPHSIGQCIEIFSQFNDSNFTRDNQYSGVNLGLVGASSAGQFVEGGTYTWHDFINEGPFPGMCAWSNSVFAKNGSGSATATAYDFDWLCWHREQKHLSNLIALGYNCAGEWEYAQTNLTHQYWVTV